MTAGARHRGFTLVEAVIALAVLAVGITLAGSLLVQSQRMIAQAGMQARTPVADLGVARLRAELQGAAGIDPGPAPAPGWSRDRLDLVYPDGSRVRWEKRGSTLVRWEPASPAAGSGASSSDRGGGRRFGGVGGGPSAPGGRAVLQGVASWRWLREGPRLLTVEITTLESADRAALLDPVGPIDPGARMTSRRITVTLRGGGLGWGW